MKKWIINFDLVRLSIGISFMLIVFSGRSSFADELIKNFTENRFDSDYSVNFFKTDSNYDASGSQVGLPSGNSFQLIDISLQARYVVLQDLGLLAGLNIANSESNDSFAARKNSTLNYFNLGVDYQFFQSTMMSFYSDLNYKHATEKIASDTDSALNSDGADEVQVRVVSIFDLDFIKPFGSIGINYRTQGLSTLLTYQLGVQSRFDEIIIGSQLNGYTSVTDDSKTSSTYERESITNRVNAYSKKFYSVNPNLLDADIYFKYIINSDFSIKANGGYTVIGSNNAVGYHIGATLSWGFGGSTYDNYSKPTPKAKPNSTNNHGSHIKQSTSGSEGLNPRSSGQQPKVHSEPVKKFQEDTNDGVNQDYFKPVSPSQEPYVSPVQQKSGGTQVMESEEEMSTVTRKKEIDNPEYKIKLKRKKKKTPSN